MYTTLQLIYLHICQQRILSRPRVRPDPGVVADTVHARISLESGKSYKQCSIMLHK